jgi:hypothetical protein
MPAAKYDGSLRQEQERNRVQCFVKRPKSVLSAPKAATLTSFNQIQTQI